MITKKKQTTEENNTCPQLTNKWNEELEENIPGLVCVVIP